MSRVKLPAFLEEMPDGPHKRDEIRRYKRLLKKRKEKNEQFNFS